MAIPLTDALPVAPSRERPTTFAPEGDKFFSAVEKKFQPQVNAAITGINQTAEVVDNSSTAALIASQNAAAAQASAFQSANVAAWVSGTTYALNAAVISQVNFQTYRKKTNSSSSTTDPANDSANWTQIGSGTMQRLSRTSNVNLVAGDRGKIIDIDSGTFTQTFASASSLGNEWYVYLRNNGTGDITLDPSGSELIDGLTSYVMYPGECRLIQCNGTDLKSVVLTPFCKTFIASGTFVKPPGYSLFEGMLWGGGGSGAFGGGVDTGGGTGGACVPFTQRSAQIAASTSVVIGAGGAARTSLSNGLAGGTSTWNGISALGGYGGTTSGGISGPGVLQTNGPFTVYNDSGNPTNVALPGFGGGLSRTENSGSDLAKHSVFGGGASIISTSCSGGNSVYGGAAGGSVRLSPTAVAGGGGTSTFGGNGGAASLTTAASGVAPAGGGGAAASTPVSSGAGARGEMVIWGK